MERQGLVQVPGEITSVALGHVAVATENVYDYDISKYLKEINQIAMQAKEISDNAVQRINTHLTLLSRLLEEVSELNSTVNFSPRALEVLNDLKAILENNTDVGTAIIELITTLLLLIPNIVHITLSEYDSLTPEELNNGSWYFIEEDE